jgi:formate hydrogenlyase transcriptional activator
LPRRDAIARAAPDRPIVHTSPEGPMRERLDTSKWSGALLGPAEIERLQAENDYLRERSFAPEGFTETIGESLALRRVLFQAEQVAPTDTTVLLLGETGTGKELIAKAIHGKSRRRDRTLINVNCAALPPTLIESEIFGHEKGAFTGASSRKIGRFELADRSTLFLDEIGELPLALQAKLLRVLEEGEFERLGSSVTHKVEVRIIAASNRDLSAAAREGAFRADLYYRLRVFPIEVPPLRARKEDIPLLVWHFLGQLGTTLGKKIERVPVSTMERLVRYDWPGNVRELRNVLERAVILSPGTALLLDDLDDSRPAAIVPPVVAGRSRTLADVERDHILGVLEALEWRVRGPGNAAEELGLNASTLYSRMKKLGIRRAIPGARPLRPRPHPGLCPGAPRSDTGHENGDEC